MNIKKFKVKEIIKLLIVHYSKKLYKYQKLIDIYTNNTSLEYALAVGILVQYRDKYLRKVKLLQNYYNENC